MTLSAATLFAEGNTFFREGKFQEAVDRYRAALEREPLFAEAHFNLGCALDRGGDPASALPHFMQAVSLRRDWGEARFNLGCTLARLGKVQEALPQLQAAAAISPANPGIRNNLGLTLSLLGRNEEAEAAFLEALRLDPRYAQAHNNLSVLYERFGRTSEAITAAEGALRLNPAFPEALNSLANALKAQGRAQDALPLYREALRINPQFLKAHSSLLFALNYPAGIPGEAILAEHRAFGDACTRPFQPHSNDPDPQRKIRLGYLSADFRDHAVARFIEPVLKNHDRSAFQLFCYANVCAPDRHTEYLSRLSEHWRDISHLSDTETERLIRDDGIDILVDLSGHTAGNRLPLFGRKPAPVQVTWIGYPQTTGLSAIDYRITDEICDPIGLTDRLHTERLLRLPGAFTCFEPVPDAPEVGPLPALKTGTVTFGSFNNPAKITPETVALWCTVLRAIPTSRIVVKGYSLADAGTRRRLVELFACEGISSSRLILMGNTPTYAEHLALYRTVDIALDSYPYNGTTTTCEALWMGVPVVSLCGGEHRSRVGATLLSAVGLPFLVAGSAEEFRDAAVSLGGNLEQLGELRASLREMMAASPLLDAPTFARKVEKAFRGIWEEWCGRGKVMQTTPAPLPPRDLVTAGEGYLAQGLLDEALRSFLVALEDPLTGSRALPWLEKTFNAVREEELAEELDRCAAAVGGERTPPNRCTIASDTLLRIARALLQRGLITSADLLCRHLLERDGESAPLHRAVGDVARELGEDGYAARHYGKAVELGDGSTGTAIALLKAREAERCKGGRSAQNGFLLIKAWGYGFWSDVSHLLGALLLAEITGRTPVVHWGGNSLFSDVPAGNAFETFFAPLSPVSLHDLSRSARSFFPGKWHAGNLAQEGVNVWSGAGSRLSALHALGRREEVVVSDFHFSVNDLVPWIPPGHRLYGNDPDSLCRDLFQRYLTVRPEIAAEVEDFHRRRMAGLTLLAVHARGGDKGGEDPNLERLNALYPPYIDRFLASHPEARLFLITDDDTLLARFSGRYGERIIHGDAVRTANGQGVHYQHGTSRYRLGKEVLVDVLLALRCDAFIGNGLSNVSCAVAQLKDWQGRSTLLGARLDRLRAFTMYGS
ncbi:tetratricopeptide repeat protein [Geomonas sp. RF6]|uniref:tetratricopeptide repeat protein n=1 Tax=Geomonas sp. RF6 TaxID=2897342 RepID=UPI001E560A40|nr:tetratricopeptide repeat protein [Geomonas sp. RF6]UFS72425.1 tetratricopeptide repeat protein [Geomonas sp. RF6]